ncbi:6-deoxyerythronolide-B synthase [Cutibacterium acnes HL042PA3]|nr:6-deoxyerythronolide-B synthase [Cutibacterium acnes HL042PA3]
MHFVPQGWSSQPLSAAFDDGTRRKAGSLSLWVDTVTM